jgi:hypothetical protein
MVWSCVKENKSAISLVWWRYGPHTLTMERDRKGKHSHQKRAVISCFTQSKQTNKPKIQPKWLTRLLFGHLEIWLFGAYFPLLPKNKSPCPVSECVFVYMYVWEPCVGMYWILCIGVCVRIYFLAFACKDADMSGVCLCECGGGGKCTWRLS